MCKRLRSQITAGYVRIDSSDTNPITIMRTTHNYQITEMGRTKLQQVQNAQTVEQLTPAQKQAKEVLSAAKQRVYGLLQTGKYGSYNLLKIRLGGIRESTLDRYLRELRRAKLIQVVNVFDGQHVTDKTITVL